MARIAWVDRTKGWGMILIMAGHGDIPFRLALSFVPVPVFFFFSGYLFHERKYGNFYQLVKARTRTLLIPYLLFAVANCGVWLLLHPAEHAQGWLAALWPLTKQILAVRRDGEDPYLGPYWFILCLFVTQLAYYLVAKTGDLLSGYLAWSSLRWRTVIIALLTMGGFVYVRNGSHWLPWSLDVSLVAIAFYGAGHVAQLHARFDSLFERKWLIAPCLIGLLAGVMNTETSARRVGMYEGFYNNPALYLLGAYSGLYLFLFLMRRVPDYKPVQMIGQESLIFLVLHYPIFLPMGVLVDGVFSSQVLDPIVPHPHLLHELVARMIKGTVGAAITVVGLVIAYILIAPLAMRLRRFAGWFFEDRKGAQRSSAAALRDTTVLGERGQLADTTADVA